MSQPFPSAQGIESNVVRRHRRRGAMTRWATRVGIAVLLALTLVAGKAILDAEPEFSDALAPFYISGEPDEKVQVDDVAVTVTGVHGGVKLKRPDGLVVDSAGVWIVVRVRVEAVTKTTTVNYLALEDVKGRTFRISQRFTQSLGENARDLQPGIPVEGEIAFEVPKDVATDLRFQLSSGRGTSNSLRAVANIRLPIAAGAVTQWLADSTPATIAEAKVVS